MVAQASTQNAEPITVVIADTDQTNRMNLRDYLLELGLQIVGEARDGEQCLALVYEQQPDFLFVADDLAVTDGLLIAHHLSTRRCATLVALIATQGRFDFLRRAMQAGVREILLKPIQRDEVQEAVTNLTQMLDPRTPEKAIQTEEPTSVQEMASQQMVISVFSTKGGVGKSLLSVNIAVMLKELTNKKVALMDLNFQSGDVAVLMNITAGNTTLQLVESDELTEAEIQNVLVSHSSGVDVLPAPGDM